MHTLIRIVFTIILLSVIEAGLAAEIRFNSTEAFFVDGEFLIEKKRSFSERKMARFLASESSTEFTIASLGDESVGLVKLGDAGSQKGWVNLNDHLAMLERAPGVKRAEMNHLLFPSRAVFNDPKQGNQWYLSHIRAPNAWEIIQDASDITVAVIDDAIMTSHEDLKDNLWTNPGEIPGNGRDDDGNGYVDDIHGWNFGAKNSDPGGACLADGGHGTHVSGAIGALGGNRKGVVGMAPRVRIMALAVSRPEGCQMDSGGIIAAVNYAVDNGARVINLSLGGPARSSIAKAAYQKASDAGVLIVIAAGNAGLSNDREDIPGGSQLTYAVLVRSQQVIHRDFSPSYPSSFSREIPGILSVANLQPNAGSLKLNKAAISWSRIANNARLEGTGLKFDGWTTLRDGQMPIGSSYGERSVHIGTPGTDIYSTVPTVSGARVGSDYKNMTGTSMASPITAGAAALVWAAFPDMTNLEIKARLLDSAKSNRSLQGVVSSAAQLDMFAALCGDMFSRKASGCPGARAKPKPPTQRKEPPKKTPPKKAPPKNEIRKPEPAEPEEQKDANDWLREEW